MTVQLLLVSPLLVWWLALVGVARSKLRGMMCPHRLGTYWAEGSRRFSKYRFDQHKH